MPPLQWTEPPFFWDIEGEIPLKSETWIQPWLSEYIHYKVLVWDEITYSLPNFNDAAISSFIPYFLGHGITYPSWN